MTGEKASPWSALNHVTFRWLWLASIASNIGTWMHEVGAGWLMTGLSSNPMHVALVQVAGSAPMFLLALPAGAMADIIDKRRYLLGVQLWMAAVEDGGGQVKVTPPPVPFGTRSPVMLIGAIASLWSASKAVSEMAQKAQYERAKRYNAEVVLKLDKGETVIDRIVFSQKP